MIKSLLSTIFILFVIYNQTDDRDFFSGFWFIAPLFLANWFFWEVIQKPVDKDTTQKSSKVIDLSKYRQKKAKESKDTKETKNWVTIYTSLNSTEISLIKSLLASEYIESKIVNRHMASMFPSIEGVEMQLQVERENKKLSLKLLKEHNFPQEANTDNSSSNDDDNSA